MSSETYWKDREAKNLAQNQLEEEEYSRRLKAIYQNQLDAIQKEIDGFYGKYADSEGITLAEAKKRVAKLDIEAYERKAARYVAEKNFSEKANREMRLYNATMKINRLELLKANIGLELIAGHEELDRFMEEILQGRTEDELKRQAGILGKTVQQNAKTASSIVNASFHNATFSDRIWMYQDLLKNELASTLQSGLIQGKNPRELAKTIRQRFDVQISHAERLMRTELARVQTDAQKRSFEENGFEEYEFIANGHCCPICDALDGKHFNLRDLMPGKNAPPMHPNCVLPNTKIIAPDAEAMMRSEYSGNIIEIGTSNGTRLSVTPNHIVLTARGWVRAKNLVKGDKVVHYCNWTKSVVKANPANDDSISTVEQLFASLIKASTVPTFSMPVSPEDLKGDVIKDGKVDIIFIDSKLRSKVDSAVNKLISDIELIGTSIAGKSVLTAKCTLAELLVGVGLASDGIMSSSCVSNILFSRALTHRELVGLRLSSDYNSRLNKTAADNTSADVKAFGDSIFARTGIVERDNLFCIDLDSDSVESDAVSFEQSFDRRFGNIVDLSDLFRAFSGVIELDDIVLVTNKFYSGHVYDASSLSTLYISNGIITSNCRCSTAAYEDDEEYRAWLDYLAKGGTTEEWNRARNFAEKEESKRKYQYKDTVIHASEISSAKYRRKFTDITGENKLSRVLWENALDMLDHRSGTRYEDLAFVDSRTGNAKINKNYDKDSTVAPSESMKKMLMEAKPYTIIAIHNHPGSSSPSYSDIVACRNRKYKYGLVVCHDGTIYKYSVDDKKFNMPIAISALEHLAEKGYNKRTENMLRDAGIALEVF